MDALIFKSSIYNNSLRPKYSEASTKCKPKGLKNEDKRSKYNKDLVHHSKKYKNQTFRY